MSRRVFFKHGAENLDGLVKLFKLHVNQANLAHGFLTAIAGFDRKVEIFEGFCKAPLLDKKLDQSLQDNCLVIFTTHQPFIGLDGLGIISHGFIGGSNINCSLIKFRAQFEGLRKITHGLV